jgi:hypothetical protein
MSKTQLLHRPRTPKPAAPAKAEPAGAPGRAPARPSWAGSLAGAPFALAVPVQRKVVVGPPGDRYEREADAVAARVTGGGSPAAVRISPLVAGALSTPAQRMCADCEADLGHEKSVQRQVAPGEMPEEEPEVPVQAKLLVQRQPGPEELEEDIGGPVQPVSPVQRQPEDGDAEEPEDSSLLVQADGGNGTVSAAGWLTSHLGSPGVGAPLAPRVRASVEPVLGADLSHVQVHTDARAGRAARSLHARAFTHGSHIWLGRGESPGDLPLMAHEAAHVLQQDSVVRRQPDEERVDEPPDAVAGGGLGMMTAAPPPAAPAGTEASSELHVATAVGEAGEVAAFVEPDAPAAEEAEETTASEAPQDPREAIAPALRAVGARAESAQVHSPPEAPVGSAQSAAIEPSTEQARAAAAGTVGELDAAETERVRRDAFRDKLQKAIRAATPEPTSEAEAERVMNKGASEASGALHGELATERDVAAGPLKAAADREVQPGEIEAEPQTQLELEEIGPPPAPVPAHLAVPKPIAAERLDYSSDRAPADELMAEHGITTEQLAKGNEPDFGATLEARSEAEAHEATAAERYRDSESSLLGRSHGAVDQALGAGLEGIHDERELQIGQVVAEQLDTTSQNEAERRRITDRIQQIKDRTRADVDRILEEMDTGAANVFEAGLARAEKAYRATFEKAKGGVGTWLTTWGSDWEDLIAEALEKARDEYLRQVDIAIDQVADLVEAKLATAKQRVADGRAEVEEFVADLDDSVRHFGEEALQQVSADFDAMVTGIDQRADALVDQLTQQYKDSYDRMSAMEEELREANKSLWQRVKDATIGVVKKILAFKDMLLDVLGKAAGVIGDIIADPIGFLRNLVSAIMQGLQNFMGKIWTYLQKGLLDWLLGAFGGLGLRLPEKFDLPGIASLVLQILGLTYDRFRARAVKLVGEPVVAALEKAVEIFQIVRTEGAPGLWRFIKEKLLALKSMVLDPIIEFIKDRVIIAGITWIIGLLNPASAFFKACMAIYDIVSFFIKRGSQIIALVTAIVDSIASIAKGALGTAISLVEGALAKAIPVAIGFLASLLRLGDPAAPVRSAIESVRALVDQAIDWVIGHAMKLVRAAGELLGLSPRQQGEEDPEKAGKVAEGLAELRSIEQSHLDTEGKLSREGAEAAVRTIKSQYPVFTKLEVGDAGDHWKYEWAASPGDEEPGAPKAAGDVEVGDMIVLFGGGAKTKTIPVKVTAVNPGVDVSFHGEATGRNRQLFTRTTGVVSFDSYGRSWRKVESDADLHIQEHHKVPHTNQAHWNHPLRVLSQVDLTRDSRNLMRLGGHSGSHTAAYHAEVTSLMNDEWSDLSDRTQAAADSAMGRVMALIESKIASGALNPYDDREVWIP